MIEGKSTLDELLSDPMIQLVMERDRVRPEDVRMLLERDRSRAAGRRQAQRARVIAACTPQGACAWRVHATDLICRRGRSGPPPWRSRAAGAAERSFILIPDNPTRRAGGFFIRAGSFRSAGNVAFNLFW
jgi:hypothetical protein